MDLLPRHSLASFDVLRGIAIVAVLVAHFWPGAQFPVPAAVTIFIAQFGVILFFFLSGFLMDLTYSAEPRLFPFAVRRLFRILPMYWLSILLVSTTEHSWTLRGVVANAVFMTGPMHVTRMLGVYWTLYIEVLFYATVPLLFVIGRRAILSGPYIVLALAGTLWIIGYRAAVAPYYLVYCYLGLCFGAWRRQVIGGIELILAAATVIVVTSILPIITPFDIVSPFQGGAPLICVILLYVALQFPFRIPLLAFFGAISYSLYLLHFIVFAQIAPRLSSLSYSSSLSSIIVIVLCIAASVITLIFVERPMIWIGKSIIIWWRSTIGPPSVAPANHSQSQESARQ